MSELTWLPFEKLFAEPLRNGLTRPKVVRGAGVKMVNMGEIFGHSRIGDIPMDRVPLSDTEAKSFLLQPFDLLFARQSLVLAGAGKCSILLDISEPTTWESHIIRARLDPHIADPKFYYYFFASNMGRRVIESIVEQVAAAGIRGSDLAKLRVPYPPLPEQRAIAAVLGALDDKIELNRRMNATLEQMAQALFKSWFVDFDPVHANRNGEALAGLAPDVQTSFPATFENSALGEIPQGWVVEMLGALANVNWGDTSTTKASYVTSGYQAYSASGSDGFLPYYDFDRVGVVVSAIGANAGQTWFATGKWSCIKNTLRFWAIDPRVSTEYLYQATLRKDSWTLRGSAQPFIAQQDARSLRIIVPNNAMATKYGEIVHNYYELIASNGVQSRTLATTRDALLPKLLSGEVRVREAEKTIEEIL